MTRIDNLASAPVQVPDTVEDASISSTAAQHPSLAYTAPALPAPTPLKLGPQTHALNVYGEVPVALPTLPPYPAGAAARSKPHQQIGGT